MILDFFENGVKKRSKEERISILKNLKNTSTASDDYQNYGFDYFDNSSYGIGYGGYKYDGRYEKPAKLMIDHYGLKPGDRVLEVGCAKGFILVEFFKLGCDVYGVDTSEYAVLNAHQNIASSISLGNALNLPFENEYFSLVYGKDVLPHVKENDIAQVLKECYRVSRGNVFFEIGVGETQEEIDRMKTWDVTQLCVRKSEWWEDQFSMMNFECDRHYKILL